jgi:hypothetical protein
MRRLLALIGALAVMLAIGAPVLAAEPAATPSGRVLISVQGDVTIPAGEQADVVVVVQGNAVVEGTVNTLTVVGGTATINGGRLETLAIVDGTAALEPGTIVTGDVLELNSAVSQAAGVTIGGSIRPMAENLAGFALFLGAAALLIWAGAALAMLAAGLVLAAFAARQVRSAELVISREPVKAFLVGLAMIVIPPILAFVLVVTILGLPLGLSVLFFVWPALAFVGYLVAAIWFGEWLLRAAGRTQQTERPYLAATVGLLIVGIAGIVPLVSFIVSVFGLGAVTVAGWRTLTGGQTGRPSFQPTPAPVAG